ncbi:hypothetical protein [Roseibacillus ishigakijimensis]|uniref:Uncharacterized protein n=1 Tax=Roseibacillus ishigakijimensis TaxID=454146 RepID=A0A934RQF5_9BACT|nr:hypothetical protein [Roseibacillus ishigakijimensis]MBK1835589.1 hypothetical protein [Roseibacillus ishigakijimensis]
MARAVQKSRFNTILRVYLGKSHENQVEALVAAGCEVVVMEEVPGMVGQERLWPLLALEEDRLVTFTDTSLSGRFLLDVQRTELVAESGLGGWRIPYHIPAAAHEIGYRPINPLRFGSCRSYPVRELLGQFLAACEAGEVSSMAQLPWGGSRPIAGARWPHQDFASWFLMSVLYPRMAAEGLLTLVPAEGEWPFLPLDIEYATWANPASEVLLTRPARDPWETMVPEPRLRVREGAQAYRRTRVKKGPRQGIDGETPAPEVNRLPGHEGGLRSWLGHCQAHCSSEWWIDFSPQLRLGKEGGDLFLDRSYESCDVVTCGSFFLKLSAEMIRLAREEGLNEWREGDLLKVPKLEGPATLWRADFARQFLSRWDSSSFRPEFLLRLQMEQGRARVRHTTTERMGWQVR